MILQALDAYYRRKQSDPDPAKRLPAEGLDSKEIPFILEIDTNGRLLNIADTRDAVGTRTVAQRFLVPQGVKKTSAIAANLLWDNAEYVLALPDPKKLEDNRHKNKEDDYLRRLRDMKRAFRARVADLPESVQDDAGVRAVLAFLDDEDLAVFESASTSVDIRSTNPIVSFRLHGDIELVCQRPAVRDAITAAPAADSDGVCLVRGERAAIKRLHPAIKGVWGAQSSGANIVSVNNTNQAGNNGGSTPAFASYGKQQGFTSPVGVAAAFAYTTALNHLLERDSAQRLQVGDTSTVFWAEQTHDLESTFSALFTDSPTDDPDRGSRNIRALYSVLESGHFAEGDAGTRFHVLGLAPNAARISIRFWETATAEVLGRRITQHFDDLEIVHRDFEPPYLSLFRLLTGIAVLQKAENIPPSLSGDLIRAVLRGLPYPAQLLNLAVIRSRAEQGPTRARAAAIKASLNRLNRSRTTPEQEFLPMLDPDNVSTAYRLGRLFAVLEKVQEEASPGLNATIRDRYYSAASSTPVSVFTTLLRLKNHHVGKLNPGRRTQMEKLIGEILGDVNAFPSILSLADQGRFALGYYHQRQSLFTKSEPRPMEETA